MADAKPKRPIQRHLLESWLELRSAVEADPTLRRLLFDPVTGLPTTPLLFPRIQALLEDRGEVSLLCLNVVKFSKIEEIYGWRVFDRVMCEVAEALDQIAGSDLRDSDIIAELMISGNAFVVVLSPPRETKTIQKDHLEALALRIEQRVREKISGKMDPDVYKKFGCYAGHSTIRAERGKRLERVVYDGLERALVVSTGREEDDGLERSRRLEQIIDEELISIVVHPVFRLDGLDVVGYEALARGPKDDEFECPDKLFKVAYDSDLVLRLERLCRRKALEAAKKLPDGRLLFLNIEPESVTDPQLHDMTLANLLTKVDLIPQRIVLEITERSAIVDFASFRATLEYLRALGFAVAVDDAGAGYGSLQCIVEVKPEWLKIDISLIRDIDTDKARQGLVSSLVTYAEQVGVGVVAEGIETVEELKTVRDLGVEYGQGFLFTLPVPPFPSDEEFDLGRFV